VSGAKAAELVAPGALVVPTNDPKVLAVRERIATLVAQINALAVDSEEGKAAAVNLLSAIARVKVEAEQARLGFVEPLKKYTQGVDRLFRETLAPVVAADQSLRGKVVAFDRAERQRIADAQAEEERERLAATALLNSATKAEAAGQTVVAEQLLDKAAVAESAAIAAAPAAATPPPAKTFSTPFGARATTRTVWDYEVTEAGEIPREYLVVDAAAVRKAIASGVRTIPGLRIFERESLSVRAS